MKTLHTNQNSNNNPFYSNKISLLGRGWLLCAILFSAMLFQGCTSVYTFPKVTRAGDTISVMVGGSDKARKDSIDVTLKDGDNINWDLQALGLVRSVFNLRADGRAVGTHYSSILDAEISWLKGHEPMQTVLVADIPAGAAPGMASLTVALNVDDDSSGIFPPFVINLEILDAVGGTSDNFLRQNFSGPVAVDFASLEPAPHAKISFGNGSVGLGNTVIGAASLVLDFDNQTVDANDLNVYASESTVRGDFASPNAPFGDKQRMLYWHQNGAQLFVDIIAPQGIEGRYLQLYVVHPTGVGDPLFSLNSVTLYNTDGVVINPGSPSLTYFP